jgi:hypothetical protein
MLVLFDFENIQNVHYKNVKSLISEHYGLKDWKDAIKQGAIARGHEDMSVPGWNTNVQIFMVDLAPQAADLKLIELASRYRGNRCIIITNDKKLYEAVCAARIEKRQELYQNTRAVKRTITEQVLFWDGKLRIRKKNGEIV